MRIVPLGDRALLLTELDVEPWRLANGLNASPPEGLVEAVAAYDSVAIHFEPDRFHPRVLEHLKVPETDEGRLHKVPVCYQLGEDLEEASKALGISTDQLIELHSNRSYRCAAVGFRPGFAYLGNLADEIAGLPRMASPRLHVQAGSVGITGRQTGVYPQAGPGGWWIIGRTPSKMVDPESGYYPIEAGDEVVFVPITAREFELRKGECG